ncbi:MAG: hypothetical protein H6814_07445 [Phycisphaeraceae bacterium]|nr:hypothetical protein [Phycisphaeraceae bacterium]
MCDGGATARHRLCRYHGADFGFADDSRRGFAVSFGGCCAVDRQEFEGLDRGRGGGGCRSAGAAAVEAVHAVEDRGHQGVLGGVEDLRDGDAQVIGDLLEADGWVHEAGDQGVSVDAVGEGGWLVVVVHGKSCSPWVGVGQAILGGWDFGVRSFWYTDTSRIPRPRFEIQNNAH